MMQTDLDEISKSIQNVTMSEIATSGDIIFGSLFVVLSVISILPNLFFIKVR